MRHLLHFLLLGFLAVLDCTQTTGGGDDVATGRATGRLYFKDGSVAARCRVSAVPSDLVPGSNPYGYGYETSTDDSGRYYFDSVSKGRYNIYGLKDTLGSYREDVGLGARVDSGNPLSDTLKPNGGITGIVKLSASTDSRPILIMMIGGTMIRWPDDSSGHFSMKGLAEGNYKIRFLATDPRYKVLDTSFSVLSGKLTDVGTVTLTGPDTIQVRDSVTSGVWGPNTTYLLMSTVNVPPGKRLVIREGTHIVFMGEFGFNVDGSCFAQGTVTNRIVFTHYFARTSNVVCNGGMGTTDFSQVHSADSVVFRHCTFDASPINFHLRPLPSRMYIEFKNCIFQHTPNDISISSDISPTDSVSPGLRAVMEHNVFYDIANFAAANNPGTGYAAIAIYKYLSTDLDYSNQLCRVANNIFYNIQCGEYKIGDSLHLYSQNCYFDLHPNTLPVDNASRMNSIMGNPKFIDINNSDFRLAPDSPCRGAGSDGKDMGIEFNQ
jgi:hypothetical protein